ncbi:MAG: hypothetical protein ABI600_14575 [Luteolibacter sp.]
MSRHLNNFQPAVLDRFENVVRANVQRTGKISEGAGGFEKPVMRAGGEVHFLDRMFEVAVTLGLGGLLEALGPDTEAG